MNKILKRIRFVLTRTTHPGNIGASARAMKNMGLSRLYLVSPKYFPHPEAYARSSGAEDLLTNAVVTDSVSEAIQDCHVVIGTSSRSRSLAWPVISVRECAEKMRTFGENAEIAVVFGSERTGLTNEELTLCHYHLVIPCDPDFSSLNLAAAVQVVAYELWLGSSSQEEITDRVASGQATFEQMELFYEHLQQTLIQLAFLDRSNPRLLMTKLRRLFSRAHVEENELNILRGILTAINKSIAPH